MGLHCCNFRDSGLVDTAVDADEELGFPLEEGLDFGRDVVEEEFFSGVRADAEEEDVVNLIEVIFYEAGRGAGIQGDATEDAFVCGNTREGVIDMSSVFYGEGDEICSSFCKGIDVLLWFVDEEMNVLEEVCFKSGDEG